MQKHLTEIAVRSLKSDRTLRVWDTQTKGFGVSVGGSRKTWIVRLGTKRTVRKIGSFPHMSLADARNRAKVLLIDPTEPAPAKTLEQAFNEYQETYSREYHSPRTHFEVQRLFRKYVLPTLATKRLAQLTYPVLMSVVPKGPPSEANHVFRALRAFLSWCVRKDYLPHNPLMGKEQPAKERSRDRILTVEEIKALWRTAEGSYGLLWRLLLLTGQRRGQIIALEWDWLEGDVITFPKWIMKGKKPHVLPIGEFTRSLLPPREGRYLFPSSKGGHMENTNIHQVPHDRRAGVGHYVLHDLRRTFRTIHAQIGTPLHIAEMLLDHSTLALRGVAGIYNRYEYLEEKRLAVNAFESHLQSLLSAEKVEP